MGGIDTRGRYHVHWGPPETYGERREELALRRSGRTVPDAAYEHFESIDLGPVDDILAEYDHDPKEMLRILEATQAHYGFLPISAVKRISGSTGAWYAMIYGTATYYRHLRFDKPVRAVAVCRCTSCILAGGGRVAEGLAEGLGTEIGHAPTDGTIRLDQLPGHVPGAPSPLVMIDGQAQTEVTEANAAAWARALAGKTPA